MENRIKDLRARLNKIVIRDLLSMSKVAKEIGVHSSVIDDFLYDRTKPHLVTLSKIGRFLDLKEKE